MSTPSVPESTPDVGTSPADGERRSLAVGVDVTERNRDDDAAFADERGVRLRPRTKTHPDRRFVPTRVCTTVNGRNALVGVRDGVEETRDVPARGKRR